MKKFLNFHFTPPLGSENVKKALKSPKYRKKRVFEVYNPLILSKLKVKGSFHRDDLGFEHLESETRVCLHLSKMAAIRLRTELPLSK